MRPISRPRKTTATSALTCPSASGRVRTSTSYPAASSRLLNSGWRAARTRAFGMDSELYSRAFPHLATSSAKEVLMPQKAWSNKRERQYEHVKDSEKKKGESTKRAKEIAARTVNKQHSKAGETKSPPRSSSSSSSSRSSSSRS